MRLKLSREALIMRVLPVVALVALLVAAPLRAAEDDLPTVRVFVTVSETNAFQDATRGINMSASDLVAELKRLKFEVVSTREAAQVVVSLTRRNATSAEAGINANSFFGLRVRPHYAYTYTMDTTVDVGSVRREVGGTSNKNYRDCARNLVLDLNAWVLANMNLILGTSVQSPAPSLSTPAVSEAAQRVAAVVESEPAGAEISIDGTFVGSTPSKLIVAVGDHSLRISRPGYQNWERRVTIEAGSAKTFNAILIRQDP